METTLTHHDRQQEPLEIALAYARFWTAMAFASVWTVFCFLMTLFGLLVRGDRGRRWQLFCASTWAGGILWATRCPVELTKYTDPPQGGFMYFSNHSSILDILALLYALRDTPFVFAAKRELFNTPFIGWHLRLANYVEVDRDHRDRAIQSYAKAAKQVQSGTVLAVYPEGTRSVDGTILPFKKGPFMLALETQRPIVPVAVDGAQHALRKHTLRLHGHPIRIVVGAPIETQGLTVNDRDALIRRTRRVILDLHHAAGGAPSPIEPMIAPPGRHADAK